ncbi:hypothetical protein EV2_036324 [Malus domestica]
MANLSIDAVAKHKVMSFMDGNVGYNQIKMAQEDIHKTSFRCPGHVGTYEYLVMSFRLKNAGATYQRAMNAIFHDLIGQSIEVYIDGIDDLLRAPSSHDELPIKEERETIIKDTQSIKQTILQLASLNQAKKTQKAVLCLGTAPFRALSYS